MSDLRNYAEVLRDVAIGRPVFLTRNGHGRYAILDMEEYQEYERMKRKLKKDCCFGETGRLAPEKAKGDETGERDENE